MIRRKRLSIALNFVTIATLLVLTISSFVSSGLPVAGPTAYAATDDGTLSLESTRQAYELLLDRFVYPLEPAALLGAAWEAGLPALAEAKSSADLTAPAFPDNRFEAWKLFNERMNAAWDASLGLDPSTRLTHPMIQAMARLANEGHTAFRSPSEYQDYLSWQRNDERYEGIGVSFRGKNYVILEVFPGSPAEAAGLRSGDQIVGADGVDLIGTELEEGRRRIRGPAGTQVDLLIRRATLTEPFRVTIPRAQIKIDAVRWRVLDGKVGYLRIVGFPHPSVATDVEKALEEFDRQGVRAITLDLRGNGGGRLDVGMKVASKFIKDGPVFEQLSRDGRQRTMGTVGGYWEHTAPLAVLTDGGTASMGEILASALRENEAATLFGIKTAGVVSAAQVFPLVDGAGLQVTILEIRSGRGVKMNEIGVSPDVVVEFTPADAESGVDPQLERALLWLQTHPGYIKSGVTAAAPTADSTR
ncbi:MAG: S41 family peptidase [Chloroflexota bacterium]